MPEIIISQNRGETQVSEDPSFSSQLTHSNCHLPQGYRDSELSLTKTIEFTLAIKRETNDVYIVVTIIGTDTRYFVEPDEEIKIGSSELDEEARLGQINIAAFGENDLRFELELNYKNKRVINCSHKRKDFKGIFFLKGVD
jgi:hypothetical protein